jgi:hypothetical protein
MIWLDVDDLYVDNTYQREIDNGHVKKILEKFNWRFFQAVTVTKTEHGYATIDGQHRVKAAKIHPKIKKVPCIIVEADGINEEAEGFIIMNKMQRKITPVEMYWAALSAKIPEYLVIEAIFERTGVAVYSSSGYGVLPAKTTVAVNTVLKLVKRHGVKHVEGALRVIMAAWGERTGAFIANIIVAVELILRSGTATEGAAAASLHDWEPAMLLTKSRVIAAEKGVMAAEAISFMLFGEDDDI